MQPISLKIDVTADLPTEVAQGQRLFIAAWVFAPERPPPRPAVIALVPGGSYDRRYYHAEVRGRSGYSMAEHLVGLGDIVILLDHLGVGESSRAPVQRLVTRHIAAQANDAAVRQIHARLRAGALDPRLKPIPDCVKVGGGHSMGGMPTITQQAERRTYDLLAVFGYSADHLASSSEGRRMVERRARGDYWAPDRAAMRWMCHLDDVPADVLAADASLVVEVPDLLHEQCVTPGIVMADAARIDVPVYLCFGERDVSPDPYREPSFYTRSPDVTLQILHGSGHCQNFATSRVEHWDRFHNWIASLA